MKIIKTVYNENSNFILPILQKFEDKAIVETFSLDKRKEQKSARVIQTNLGTKNLPLIAIEDENQELIAAVYPETNPDWESELNKKLND